MTDTPISTTVFISYTWDSPEHKQWVARLAQAVEEEPDLHVVFDGFDIYGGKVLPDWMDRIIASDRVVIISTPRYVEKARLGRGGAAYECSLITAELLEDLVQDTFIPVLREGEKLPSFLRTRARIDSREPRPFAEVLEEVLSAIRRQPPVKRPDKRGIGPAASPSAVCSTPAESEPTVPAVTTTGTTHSSPPATEQHLAYAVPLPPPLPKPVPARPSLSISTGGFGVAIEVVNNGDEEALNVSVDVVFVGTEPFTLLLGNVPPLSRVGRKLHELRDVTWETVNHVCTTLAAIMTGFADESLSREWSGHFILRYSTADDPQMTKGTRYFIRAATPGEQRRGNKSKMVWHQQGLRREPRASPPE